MREEVCRGGGKGTSTSTSQHQHQHQHYCYYHHTTTSTTTPHLEGGDLPGEVEQLITEVDQGGLPLAPHGGLPLVGRLVPQHLGVSSE